MTLPDPSLPWPIPMAAVALIAEREGCRLRAYRCPADKWTCGWGETEGVTPDTVWTQDEADRRLCVSLTKRAGMVATLCTEAPAPNQLGALTSLQYNIGAEGFRTSSVLKAHNRRDWMAAARAFSLWDKARIGGVLTVLPGLTARRAAEAALYLTPEPDAPREPMPQAVQAESPLAASPMVQAGATTSAGGGVLVALESFKGDASTFGTWAKWAKGYAADVFGLSPELILPAVLIVAGLLVIRWRLKQRREGWA